MGRISRTAFIQGLRFGGEATGGGPSRTLVCLVLFFSDVAIIPRPESRKYSGELYLLSQPRGVSGQGDILASIIWTEWVTAAVSGVGLEIFEFGPLAEVLTV